MIYPQPKPVARAKRPRTSLRRVTSIKRTRMKQRPPRRPNGPGSEPGFLAWVRTQPCLVRAFGCQGRTEAHHAGKNPGVGMKAPDNTAVPLCRKHHREITDHSGMFKSLGREVLRAWQDAWIGETYARYLSHGNRRAA